MNPPSLSRGQLLAYGLTGLPLAALGLPLYVYLPAFYGEHLSLAVVGAVLLAARLWDMLTDPLVGVLGDRFGPAWGRRRSWMLAGVPLLLISVEQLFRPGATISASYLLVWSMLAYLGWTLVALPYTAWGADLSPDYHRRSQITASREAFVILGTLLAVSAPALLGAGDAPGEALDVLAGLLWLVLPVAVLVSVWRVPEARAPARARTSLRGFGLVLRNRPFVRLFCAYILNGAANGIPASLFVLFVAHVLEAPQATGPLLALYFAAGVLALPVWLALARRFEKHRVWGASMLLACGVFACVPFLGAGDVWAFAAICAASGVSLGVDMALPASIQADVVDLDESRSGARRAGLFFGLWGVGTKLALALAVGLTFPLLDLAGFEAAPGNPPQALLALALLYSALPVLIKLTAVALVWRFPLGRAHHARIRAALSGADALCAAR